MPSRAPATAPRRGAAAALVVALAVVGHRTSVRLRTARARERLAAVRAAAPGADTAEHALAAADAYLAALLSHDGSAVPLLDRVLRVENGVVTARSAAGLRHDLTRRWKYGRIRAVRDREDVVTAQRVDVRYLLDVGRGTVRVEESFEVADGRIGLIEVRIRRARRPDGQT